MALSDTIYALSSGGAPSAIAVVRLSGPGVAEALQKLTRKGLPPPRLAKKAALYYPQEGALLDLALILWFPAPASYSGEDMAELHLHGGPAVVASVLAALSSFKGFRLAEPGEFTRRAFHLGKLDLTEIEGLADLIAAETEAQARQALAQAGGALTKLAGHWREELANASARLEAALDFSDEGVPDEMIVEARKTAEKVAEEISRALKQSAHGERLRQGFTIVIVGAPNAGKSSLLNTLVGREAAIVSARAGTTRDLIEVHLSLAGLPVTLVDTAGLSLAPLDELDEEAMRRARERAERADLRLELIEPSGEAAPLPAFPGKRLRVASKADLPGRPSGPVDLEVSAKTGAGLAELLERLAKEARQSLGGGESALVTRERQRLVLVDCQAALYRTKEAALPELLAEDYRLALRALGRLVGKVDVEELLDRIFRQFCIGK